MGKKSKSGCKKRGKIHRHRHKKEKHLSPRKSRRALLTLSAASSTCQEFAEPALGEPASTSAAAAGEMDYQITYDASTAMPPTKSQFQKFKDDQIKPLKRLNNTNPKPNRNSYSQKLAISIKRRAFSTPFKGALIAASSKRKLDFQRGKQQPTEQPLAKPKFYRNNQATGSMTLVNAPINEDEIIEEIESSDEDDCIVLEPSVAKINIDDDSEDESTKEPTSSSNADDDNPTFSRFEVDRKREVRLWESFSNGTSHPVAYPINCASPAKNNDTCIIIDDSFDNLHRNNSPVRIIDDRREPAVASVQKPPTSQKPENTLDDSVIFVQEDFIPLSNDRGDDDHGAKRKRNMKSKEDGPKLNKTPRMTIQRMNESLFTTTERKKLADYNSNTYNPGIEMDGPVSHKRPIIIDGSNVAFGHGCSNIFSAEGIKYCVEYFQKMGHDVKAVIPLFRRNPNKSSNPALLDQLHKEGKIVFTPCKNLPNQQSISYDDRFILQLAYERNAAVVSNDNYRDLITENVAFKKIIENRVIGYSWCDNILILPKDPYGRFGPPLAEILRC
ncbi:NEDD4-binding protein 1-like isoform X2 [Drosophila montana]|uniref:NEDD4-binding protein 1-like isoform X2 n=1 Tax=Drosophila montana TaxID=40370 RepID=UPI00313BD5A5